MNRILPLLATVLLAAACDDRMKTTEGALQPVAPDNTRTNARDRDTNRDNRDPTLTPMDQGNSSAETAITAEIRKAMMAESSLSFTAKNVKVMTVGSHVTLRGPVMSAEEKTLIAAVATRASGVSDVDNQLEVKP